MHRSALTAAVLLAACSGGAAPQSEPSRPAIPGAPSFPAAASMPRGSDARAREIADRVMTSLGGKEAWDRTRYLRFGFGGVRDGKWSGRMHHWDKWSGRYRVEGTTRDGKPFVTLMNLNTKQGEAWLEGKKLAGDDLQKALERGYGMWVNDTYWLLMPYKLNDPGVVLTYAGEDRDNGATYDKLRLRFESVGLTPKDQYWAYVNRKTGLVDRWDYVLKGENKPKTTFMWTNWKKHGSVMLADDRKNPADGMRVYFPVLEVEDQLADSVFTTP